MTIAWAIADSTSKNIADRKFPIYPSADEPRAVKDAWAVIYNHYLALLQADSAEAIEEDREDRAVGAGTIEDES